MAVFEETWQKAKASIRERGIFMLNNDVLKNAVSVSNFKQTIKKIADISDSHTAIM